MQLMLMRHGIAETRTASKTDADRALTDKGVTRTKAAANGLTAITEPPDRILTSPKRRAHQTADIVAKAYNRKVETWELLSGSASDEDIADALKNRNEDRLMLVGHEPIFSELIERLCYRSPHGGTELKKAGCAILEMPTNTGRATLQALLPPHVLRALAGEK